MAHKGNVALVAAAAVTALAGAAVLRGLGVEPVPTIFYLLAWYPTLLLLDALVAMGGGPSLLGRPRETAAMLGWSVVIWCVFEAINFRLRDWYYVFAPASQWQRWLGVSVSFATVVPAILLPERLLDRLGVAQRLVTRSVPLARRDLHLSTLLGVTLLAGALVLPAVLHPLTWGALWLLAEPLLYRVDPEHSLFGDITRGAWGRIVRLLLAGLFAGVLWEGFNAMSRAKWIYTVPFLEELKIFEMPPLGFIGFAFFALEAWSLYYLCRRWRSVWLVPLGTLLVALTLAGIDHWTVSSTLPYLQNVSGISAAARAGIERAGITNVFQLASLSPDTVATRAAIPLAEARSVIEAARLVTLRGIGTRHAAQLQAVGIPTVAQLAAADPDRLWRSLPRSIHPTPAEVRVWVRAARDTRARIW